MGFWKQSVLFYVGGTAYMTLEFLWRGRSHGSMFLLGGTCFVLLGALHKKLYGVALPLQLLLSAGMVTALELLTGLLVNRRYTVWDYRGMPYHYHGQICLNYSLLWIPVSFLAIMLYRRIEPKLAK